MAVLLILLAQDSLALFMARNDPSYDYSNSHQHDAKDDQPHYIQSCKGQTGRSCRCRECSTNWAHWLTYVHLSFLPSHVISQWRSRSVIPS